MGFDQNTLLETAREYCRLIESVRPGGADWLESLGQLLPRLHALITGLDLPAAGARPHIELDLDSRFDLYSRLHEALGDRDGYWLEFDVPRDNLPASGSLADDLTDIYCDLRLGLNRLAANDDARQTLSDWQRGFSLHWGQHLVDAERHLYVLNSRSQSV